MDIVIDASVAVGWFVRSQSTPVTNAALEIAETAGAIVPAHFGLEVLRSLRRLQRRDLLAASELLEALSDLQSLLLKQDSTDILPLLPTIHALADRHNLAAADAAYLELAMRRQASLATRDAVLISAARASGVALFAP